MKNYILLCVGVLLLAGCSKDFMPDDSFYNQGDKTVAVMWMSKKDTATHVNSDNGGLLGAVIGEMVKSHDINRAAEEVLIFPIVENHYLNPYANKLSEKGLSAQIVTLPISEKK